MNDDMDKLVERMKSHLRGRLGLAQKAPQPVSPDPLAFDGCLDTFHRSITGETFRKLLPEELQPYRDEVYLSEGNPARCHADTLVVSDIHLGSPVSRAQELQTVLRSWTFRRLVILGDLFDSSRFQRLSPNHWEFLSHLRAIRQAHSDAEVIWVTGNHDAPFASRMAKMLGAELVDEETPYFLECGGRRYAALHGHQFDPHVRNYPARSHFFCLVYLLIQRADRGGDRRFSRWVKRQSKEVLRVTDHVAARALLHARGLGVDTIICGHTHLAVERNQDGISYVNSGCWTETPSTLVAITESGARLVEYY